MSKNGDMNSMYAYNLRLLYVICEKGKDAKDMMISSDCLFQIQSRKFDINES